MQAIHSHSTTSVVSTTSGSNTWNRSLALAVGAAAIGIIGVLAYRKYHKEEHGLPEEHPWSPPTSADKVQHVFTVTTKNGFLPLLPPLKTLPAEFAGLESVVAKLSTLLADKDPEALHTAVTGIPQYSIPDDASPVLLQSLMRDYSILVSAYLLEGQQKSGKPRSRVPANVSIPFTTVAKRLDEQWIMSYDSYCLTNCMSIMDAPVEPETGLRTYEPGDSRWHWENLRLVRGFDGGPEEYTFIAVHFEIESNTPQLIKSYENVLNGVRSNSVEAVRSGLELLKTTVQRIIVSQLKMFNASDPHNYEGFVRPWIFGWKGNADFEGGVVFEGASAEPTFLRGETGAQSSIIPSLDIMLGITHKADQLRTMLAELEAYRPKPQRDFLSALRTTLWGADVGAGGGSTEVGGVSAPHALRDFVRASGDKALAKLFNECVAHVWAFRDIHVTFASLYIGKYTSKETATGGTPYKVYLRKHRDESIAHQITELGDDCVIRFPVPATEVFNEELDSVLVPATKNGIPPHLMTRHADIIEKFGNDSKSLHFKDFPTGEAWKKPRRAPRKAAH